MQEEKFIPLHLKAKYLKQKQKEIFEEEFRGLVFEAMPMRGELKPQQRMNVQIKFMPKEEV